MPTLSYPEILEAEAEAHAQRRSPIRLVIIFLAVFFSLQYGWELSRGTAVEHAVIDQATVVPSAWIINQIWPDQHVVAEGHRLVAPMGRLNILNGCEGMETLFLLVAAFVAYPVTWRKRWLGIGLGFLLVYALNQARLLLLWHTFLTNRELFGALHGTVLPLLMVACCFIYYLVFLSRHDPESA
ncbi:MAG: exosortase/archaeosortase family protein [Thiobacillaceae bacterium]